MNQIEEGTTEWSVTGFEPQGGLTARRSIRLPSASSYIITDVHRGYTPFIEWLLNYSCGMAFICGGYARYCASENKHPVLPCDIDLFPKGEKAFKYISSILKDHFKIVANTDFSLTFATRNKAGIPLQLIKPVEYNGRSLYGKKAEDILDQFDFTICKAAIVYDIAIRAPVAIVHKDFSEDEKHRRLSIGAFDDPKNMFFRAIKYTDKGYHLNSMDMIRLLASVEDIDPKHMRKLNGSIVKATTENDIMSDVVQDMYREWRRGIQVKKLFPG